MYSCKKNDISDKSNINGYRSNGEYFIALNAAVFCTGALSLIM